MQVRSTQINYAVTNFAQFNKGLKAKWLYVSITHKQNHRQSLILAIDLFYITDMYNSITEWG